MMIPGFVTIIVIEVSYVRQKKISFDPKCHGCVFFCSDVMKQSIYNSDMIARLSDLLFRISNDVRGVRKHASIVQTQLMYKNVQTNPEKIQN